MGTRRSNAGDLVGFKMHWHLHPPQSEILRETMELFLFRDGYGGLALVERGAANLCLVVRRNMLRSWRMAKLSRHCHAKNPPSRAIASAAPCWQRPLAISPIPYGYLAAILTACGVSAIRLRSSLHSPAMECRSPCTALFSQRRCISTAKTARCIPRPPVAVARACASRRASRARWYARLLAILRPSLLRYSPAR